MPTFMIDDRPVEFKPGQTIMQAAMNAGVYIPHLCFHPEFAVHGSCRICIVLSNDQYYSACTTPAVQDMQVINIRQDVQEQRKQLLEMLFVEGNHVCPSCEKSGNCRLQSVAEFCGLLSPDIPFQYPNRPVDASHQDFMLDLNRCILCELCVRASRDIDQKSVFAISDRGNQAQLIINSVDGSLAASQFEKSDRAASVCPVGAILPKHRGFEKPIGQREFDLLAINERQDS